MRKQCWCGPVEPVEPISCSFGLATQAFEFPTCPANDIEVDPFKGRTQRCPIEVAEVVDPATDARIGDCDQITQGFVTMQMTPPCGVPDLRETTTPSSIMTGTFSQRSM